MFQAGKTMKYAVNIGIQVCWQAWLHLSGN